MHPRPTVSPVGWQRPRSSHPIPRPAETSKEVPAQAPNRKSDPTRHNVASAYPVETLPHLAHKDAPPARTRLPLRPATHAIQVGHLSRCREFEPHSAAPRRPLAKPLPRSHSQTRPLAALHLAPLTQSLALYQLAGTADSSNKN